MRIKMKAGGNVTINGRTYQGENISIVHGVVTIDGKVPEEDLQQHGPISVVVNGHVHDLQLDAGTVEVNGNVVNLGTQSGNVTCRDVNGDVSTMSGSVDCAIIRGDCSTMSGNIRTGN